MSILSFLKLYVLFSIQTTKTDQGISFSQVETDAYVPQVHSSMFPHPLIACDSRDLAEHLFGWTDIDRSHTYYDLTKDVDFLCADIGHNENIFSRLEHWPLELETDDNDIQKLAHPFC